MNKQNKGNESEDVLIDHLRYMSIIKLDEIGAKPRSIIEILRVGVAYDRGFKVTEQMLSDLVDNFNKGVYGTELQVDLRHDREGMAAGWIKRLVKEGEKLFAEVEWTPLGVEMIKSEQYKYTSSELSFSQPDVTNNGKTVKNVLVGVALTNIPAIKGMAPVTLSEDLTVFLTNNHNSMKSLKATHESLMKKDKVSKEVLEEHMKNIKEAKAETPEDKKANKDMLEECKSKMEEVLEEETPEEEKKEEGEGQGDADQDKQEAKEEKEGKLSEEGAPAAEEPAPEVAPVEEVKVEEPAPVVEEEKPAEEPKVEEPAPETPAENVEEKKEVEAVVENELAEKMGLVKMSELLAEQKKSADLQEQIDKFNLSEEVENSLLLSEEHTVGFLDIDKDKVVEFMMGLTPEKKAAFKELFLKARSVDLSTRGGEGVNVNGIASEDAVVSLAETILASGKAKDIREAQDMALEQLSPKA